MAQESALVLAQDFKIMLNCHPGLPVVDNKLREFATVQGESSRNLGRTLLHFFRPARRRKRRQPRGNRNQAQVTE